MGGGYAARFFLLFSFPCSADHERDWPPCKVVFFGLATNTLNVRNNNNILRDTWLNFKEFLRSVAPPYTRLRCSVLVEAMVSSYLIGCLDRAQVTS